MDELKKLIDALRGDLGLNCWRMNYVPIQMTPQETTTKTQCGLVDGYEVVTPIKIVITFHRMKYFN